MDNYGTHKTALIRRWLAKRPRFHVHFTPTYGSWLNLVERFFADLTREVVRDGSFASVRELVEDIWRKPGICPNWRSSGEVTSAAMTSGLAPG